MSAPTGAPKFIVPESQKIREEMERVNPGSRRYEELMHQLEDLYKARTQ
jgi:hypothetical protein